ncbi:MAG: ABC transporter substrate-binding protein [Firmicutes bacterium]|nr:ABC transporter substrate-binding protein [Bacillota bacterium]
MRIPQRVYTIISEKSSKKVIFMRRIITVMLAVILILPLAGCKKGAKTLDNSSIVVLEDNSDINLAISGISNLNPLETSSKSVQSIMNIIYEPLFTYDEKISTVPVLAESYSLSEDGRQMTIKLKDGVKWHDGTNLTAEDVIYTLSKLIHSKGLYKKTADKISSFTAISKNEVVINFNKQELDFSYNLTFPILSKNTGYVSGADFVPVGTGAYKLATKSENEIVLEPNSLWHGDVVPRKKVFIKLLRDSSALAETFNVNETDAILSEEAQEAGHAPKSNSQTKQIVSNNMIFLGFNTQNPRLLPEVRRAIELLLDKQAIVEKNAYGYGKVCDISVNPDCWAYESAGLDGYSQDYTAKLLKHSGYVLENGVYSNGEYTMTLGLIVNADNEEKLAIAYAISEMLSGTGFDIKVDALDYDSYLSRIDSGNYDMFLGETETDSVINPLAMLDSASNYFGFDASELKGMMSELYGVSNQERYKKCIKDIAIKFAENPPYVPLFFTTMSMYYGSNVSGITQPTLTDRYKDIEKWYFYNTKTEDGDNRGE